MRFLVDAQLPAALAQWLAAQGHAADHVGDLGLQAASDSTIWEHAMATQAAVISKDEDFARRRSMTSSGPVIVWIRLPNTRRRDLIVWFAIMLPKIVDLMERGETVIEVA